MTTMETERLVLRNFRTSDWEALHEMILQYESSGFAAYDQPWPTSAEEIKGVTGWFASGDSYLAVTFLRVSDPGKKIPWPPGLDDDCIKPTPGGLPTNNETKIDILFRSFSWAAG